MSVTNAPSDMQALSSLRILVRLLFPRVETIKQLRERNDDPSNAYRNLGEEVYRFALFLTSKELDEIQVMTSKELDEIQARYVSGRYSRDWSTVPMRCEWISLAEDLFGQTYDENAPILRLIRLARSKQ